jgi:hypothetical protein
MSEQLYWHCVGCGDHDVVGDEEGAALGDKEKCIVCGDSFAEVMTLKQAAKIEQQIALGIRVARKKQEGE